MSERLQALQSSVRHLRDVVSNLEPSNYTSRAYPSEWTIADTLSHLGSGAVIGQRRFEDALSGRESDPNFNASVWDEWNAKEPARQVQDCLVSDASLLARLEEASEAQRESFRSSMGPLSLDFEGTLALRLSEHVLHTWDVEVALSPGTTLDNETANVILDGAGLIVGFAAKYTGEARALTMRTFEPERYFTLLLASGRVEFVPAAPCEVVDLEVSADELARLIYGRLDALSTPRSVSSNVVEELRAIFPGF